MRNQLTAHSLLPVLWWWKWFDLILNVEHYTNSRSIGWSVVVVVVVVVRLNATAVALAEQWKHTHQIYYYRRQVPRVSYLRNAIYPHLSYFDVVVLHNIVNNFLLLRCRSGAHTGPTLLIHLTDEIDGVTQSDCVVLPLTSIPLKCDLSVASRYLLFPPPDHALLCCHFYSSSYVFFHWGRRNLRSTDTTAATTTNIVPEAMQQTIKPSGYQKLNWYYPDHITNIMLLSIFILFMSRFTRLFFIYYVSSSSYF